MSRGCISNDIDKARFCTYQHCLKCFAPKEQFKYCYWLNYRTFTGFEEIYNE